LHSSSDVRSRVGNNYYTHIYRLAIIQTFTGNHYVHAYRMNNAIMAQSPCFLLFPFLIPFCLPFISLYLLGTLLAVIGSRPPWSQVARKLISPFPSPPHSLPIPKSRTWGFPELNAHLTKTTSQIWLTESRTLPLRCHHHSVLKVWCFSLLSGQHRLLLLLPHR
jgi:hypothetical protein